MSKITYTCPKCGKEIIIETDVINPNSKNAEDKAKKLHTCKKGKK